MSFEWHTRYHQAALDGMLMLTLEERGAYNTILDLIYSRGGPIPDDCRWVAGWMGCSVKRWKLIRAALVVKGKIFECVEAGQACLMNSRALLELENSTKRSRKLAKNGAKGGQKKADNNKNSDLGLAPLKPDPSPTLAIDRTQTEDTEEDKSSSADGPPKVDPDRLGWTTAIMVLMDQGGMTEKTARPFVGRLLSANGLDGRHILPIAANAMANRTQDPRAYLTKAAAEVGLRRAEPKSAKRVGFV